MIVKAYISTLHVALYDHYVNSPANSCIYSCILQQIPCNAYALIGIRPSRTITTVDNVSS